MPTLDAASLSLFISMLSLYVASRVAWDSRFRPCKPVGVLSMFHIAVLQDKITKQQQDFVLLPTMWIRNIGARTLVVDSMRLARNKT